MNIRKDIREAVERSFLAESGFSRLRRIFLGQVPSINTIGVMTAENPNAEQLPAKENNVLNDELKQYLANGHYGYNKIKGKFEGNVENSFVIYNITRDAVVKLGKKFGQAAVIFGEKQDDGFVFEYIEDGNTIDKRNISMSDINVQGREDFYSQSKGRKFIIPFFDDVYGITEITGVDFPSFYLFEIKKENMKSARVIIEASRKLFAPNKTGSFRYFKRGIIKSEMKKIENVIM